MEGFEQYEVGDDFITKDERQAVILLQQIIKAHFGKDVCLYDEWDKYEMTSSLVYAGMSWNDWAMESWEYKKECFSNFAYTHKINLNVTKNGFRLVGVTK